MMQTMTRHGPDRTAEIMSRYRPIAPRPDTLKPNPSTDGGGAAAASDHSGVRKSPYLRTVWAHLQARPTRTRKRSRAASFSPPSLKRARTCLQGLIPPPPAYHHLPNSPAGNLAAPVRPVGSTVVVEGISGEIRRLPAAMGAAEVEEVVEAEVLPAIVSDSSNKVRICNAAYKELVGQPECGWLERAGGGACRRIGGGIWLRCNVERWLHGFSGWVRIEWERDGLKRCVRASCEALKLECVAKDYQFLWRFYGLKSGTEEDGPSADQLAI
ncbi:Unknown protein [Striga hermonthica]|uniref:DUF7950 domain-containing protein n=1 Tax=Striga hermonthica TaxID=68872 RepID=A0A9N7NQE9_STRHE|nr:Unknown protein [Striga hermonthica]